jgi:GNAT superfamily N-acetyltransferase
MDATSLWRTFMEASVVVHGGSGAARLFSGRNWLAVVTGEQHCELNHGVVTGDAAETDVRELVELFREHDVPAVVSLSSGLPETVARPFAAAEWERATLTEPLMWLDRPPNPPSSGVTVTEVVTPEDRARAVAIITEAHLTTQSDRLLPALPHPGGAVRAWLAWHGDEAISVVWITVGPRLGVWEMMTSPRHRRRGAGKAVLRHALAATWSSRTEGAFLWATPAGRPLYESFGFEPVDEMTVWALGAEDDAFAALGQTKQRL